MVKRLPEEQINEIIELYQSGLTPKEIGEHFGIMNNSVTRILKKRGIDRNQAAERIRDDPEKVQVIISKYNNGISSEVIAEELGINGTTVCRILKVNNIKIRPATENKRQYPLNKAWLDNIDSEEKAYYLGLMWSDGNVFTEGGGFKLGFKTEDKYILDHLSDILYFGVNHVSQDGDNFEKLEIYSIEMAARLIELGCMPDKTFKTRFPQWLSPELQRHFIRGLIDGDGCISVACNKPVVDFTGTSEIIEDLAKILKENLDIEFGTEKRHKERDNNITAMRLYGYNKIDKFLNWIYKDATIYFIRKFDKHMEFLEMYKKFGEKRYDNEDIENMCQMYDLGKTCAEIARLLDINSGTVYKVLDRAGKILPERKHRTLGIRSKFTEEDKALIFKLVGEGYSYMRIEAEYKLYRKAISKLIKEHDQISASVAVSEILV
jgi:DNA invertase Pin-like site-specific DNA recombinase